MTEEGISAEELEVIEEYAQGNAEFFTDFVEIIDKAERAVEKQTAFTHGSLPDGFERKDVEGSKYGWEAWKEYGEELEIEIDYTESDGGMYGEVDTSALEIAVPSTGYSWSDVWDQKH